MARHIIGCADCSHWEEVGAKNAKRCHVCRLLRNIMFMRDRMSKCWACETKFCPIARDDILCAKCAFKASGAEEILCAFCGETKDSVAKDIAVCMGCAKDIKNRKPLLNSLQRKQKERQETDPGPKPEPQTKPEPVVEI